MNCELHPQEAASLASYNYGERSVSIFADSENGRTDIVSTAERAGTRILFAGSVADGVARLADYTPGDLVLVDLVAEDGAGADLLLDRLDALSWSDRLPVIINCAPGCIDSVAARASAPHVSMMCDASSSDWVSALALAGAGREPVFREVAVDNGLRLHQLAEEVQRIAATLASLVEGEPVRSRSVSDATIGFRAEPRRDMPPTVPVTAAEVRAIIRLRRLRDRYFRSDLFADPAWDMLLDLMAARLEHIRVAVSSLCIAAAVPPTTALRWIKTMCDNGMFVRVADPEDGRRVFIELSEAAATGMGAYLGAAKAQGGLAV